MLRARFSSQSPRKMGCFYGKQVKISSANMSSVGAMTATELRRGLQSFAAPSNLRGFATIASDWFVIALAFTFWHLVASKCQSSTLRFGAWLVEIMVLANRIRALESL